jgi:hypothetical protein
VIEKAAENPDHADQDVEPTVVKAISQFGAVGEFHGSALAGC